MKSLKVLPLLFFLNISYMSFSQGTLVVDVGNLKGFVTVITPVNGSYVMHNKQQLNSKNNNLFQISIDGKEPGFIYLFHNFNLFPVFYKPGMWSKVKFEEGYNLKFYGRYRKENRWVNKWNRTFNSYIPYKGKLLTNVLKAAPIEPSFKQWKTLVDNHYENFKENCMKCDPLFKEMVNKEIPYYYANIFGQYVSLNTEPSVLWKMMNEYDSKDSLLHQQALASWGVAWDSVIQYVSFDPFLSFSPEYTSFIRSYYSLYRVGLKKELPTYNSFYDYENFILKQVKKEQKPEVYEAYAYWYFEYFLMGAYKYDERLLKDFYAFKEQFPESNYLSTLEKRMKTVIDYFNNKNEPSNNSVVLESERYNTLKELLSEFKGKIVYIDLWATWCTYCITEFEFKEGLEEFAKNNEVELLYISVDKEKNHEKWKEYKNRLKLSGNHIRASKELINDIWNEIEDGGRKGYPRYVIADKNGNIVVKNALRPSSKVEVYKQLDEVINIAN